MWIETYAEDTGGIGINFRKNVSGSSRGVLPENRSVTKTPRGTNRMTMVNALVENAMMEPAAMPEAFVF